MNWKLKPEQITLAIMISMPDTLENVQTIIMNMMSVLEILLEIIFPAKSSERVSRDVKKNLECTKMF